MNSNTPDSEHPAVLRAEQIVQQYFQVVEQEEFLAAEKRETIGDCLFGFALAGSGLVLATALEVDISTSLTVTALGVFVAAASGLRLRNRHKDS